MEKFKPSNTSCGDGGCEGQFRPGIGNPTILFHSSEYEERVLQAYSNANDLELGLGKKNGTSKALRHSTDLSSNYNNWLRYRDPLGWHPKRKQKVEELHEKGNDSEEIAEEIGSSLRYANKILEARESGNQNTE